MALKLQVFIKEVVYLRSDAEISKAVFFFKHGNWINPIVHNKWIHFELTDTELPNIPQGGLKPVVHSSSWISLRNDEQQVDANGNNKSRSISSFAHCFLG